MRHKAMEHIGPDFEAEIYFLATGEGGRRSPVASGYRPNHDLGLEETNDAQHEYVGREWVYPGESVLARLHLFAPHLQAKRLYVSMEFTVREGAKIVGRGRITRVTNPSLDRDA